MNNGNGNTSRSVKLEKAEQQCWKVILTGQETDDLGGSYLTMVKDERWRNVIVEYGVRFDWRLEGEFSIQKKNGDWKFQKGVVTRASVGISSKFDPTVNYVNRMDRNRRSTPKLDNIFSRAMEMGMLPMSWGSLQFPRTSIIMNIFKNELLKTSRSDESCNNNPVCTPQG